MATIFVRNEAGWKDLTQNPAGPIGRMLMRDGREVTKLAKVMVGKKSSRLMNSIDWTITPYFGSLQVTIGSSVRYALLHHEGTHAHPIYPRRASVLRFYWRGQMNYRTRVYHPGTRANPYLTVPLYAVTAKYSTALFG